MIGGEDSRLNEQMRRVHRSRCARLLAIELLSELGVPAATLGKGPSGEPLWPQGACGSLAHNDALAVAVVSRLDGCRGLGIAIAEGDGLQGLEDAARACAYKAVFAHCGYRPVGSDMAVSFAPEAGRFALQPLSEGFRQALSGLRAEACVLPWPGHSVLVLALLDHSAAAKSV